MHVIQCSLLETPIILAFCYSITSERTYCNEHNLISHLYAKSQCKKSVQPFHKLNYFEPSQCIYCYFTLDFENARLIYWKVRIKKSWPKYMSLAVLAQLCDASYLTASQWPIVQISSKNKFGMCDKK